MRGTIQNGAWQTMTVYPKIENFDDYRIKNREYSQCKLLNGFFDLNCDKTYTNLHGYLHIQLGLSTHKKVVDSLISFFQNEELIVIINNNIQRTNKLPIYIKNLHKSIKRFDKKHRVVFGEYDITTDKTEKSKGEPKI